MLVDQRLILGRVGRKCTNEKAEGLLDEVEVTAVVNEADEIDVGE